MRWRLKNDTWYHGTWYPVGYFFGPQGNARTKALRITCQYFSTKFDKLSRKMWTSSGHCVSHRNILTLYWGSCACHIIHQYSETGITNYGIRYTVLRGTYTCFRLSYLNIDYIVDNSVTASNRCINRWVSRRKHENNSGSNNLTSTNKCAAGSGGTQQPKLESYISIPKRLRKSRLSEIQPCALVYSC